MIEYTPLPPIAFRPMLATDFHCVLSDWMRANRKHKMHLPDAVYYTGMQKLIGVLGQESIITIAGSPDDPHPVYGWICYSRPTDVSFLIHFTYVKREYRRQGLATSLLANIGWTPEHIIMHTHKIAFNVRKKFNAYENEFFLMKGH